MICLRYERGERVQRTPARQNETAEIRHVSLKHLFLSQLSGCLVALAKK